MQYLVGIGLALFFCAAAAAGLGMDRERVFYPAVLIAVVALAGHGVMDGLHHHLVDNTGVPRVWPDFCLGFDVTATAFVAWVMRARARGERLRRAGLGPRHGEAS